MDDEHVLALVEAVHGAHLDAVHGFAANAAIIDDVGQLGVLRRLQRSAHVRDRFARSAIVWRRLFEHGPASLQARPRPVSQPWSPAFSLLLADDENSLHQLKADSE